MKSKKSKPVMEDIMSLIGLESPQDKKIAAKVLDTGALLVEDTTLSFDQVFAVSEHLKAIPR